MQPCVFFVFLVMALAFTRFGHSASLVQEDSERTPALRNVASFMEEPQGAGGDMAIPEKRYSGQYYTNSRSKHYDRAAMKNILKTMFVGRRSMQARKRSPSDDLIDSASEIASFESQLPDDVPVFVIVPARLDNSVITAFLRELDSPSEHFTADHK